MFISTPLEQFLITPILPLTIGWLDLTITNSGLVLLISLTLFLIITYLTLGKTKLIPTRWQSTLELLYEFIYNLIQEQIGNKGNKYFSFIFTLFVFILFSNLLGMIPYCFTVTSHFAITFGLSFSIFIGVTLIGIVNHGFHFFHLFLPSGVPMFLIPLIVIIEVLSYCTRAISLGLRLAANMLAGHTLLHIFSAFTWQALTNKNILILIASLAPFGLLFAFTGLEIVIAILQAYVFTVLTCSYLNDSINLH